MQEETTTRYIQNKNYQLRENEGECVMVPVGDVCAPQSSPISLNERGAFLWRFFAEAHTEEEALHAAKQEYEAEPELLKVDIHVFIEEFQQDGFLMEV